MPTSLVILLIVIGCMIATPLFLAFLWMFIHVFVYIPLSAFFGTIADVIRGLKYPYPRGPFRGTRVETKTTKPPRKPKSTN